MRPRRASSSSATPSEPAPGDVALVNQIFDRYFAHLPGELQEGLARPSCVYPGHYGAYFIPKRMWDGSPDGQGYVRWKRLVLSPDLLSPGFGPAYAAMIPGILQAYLQTQRVGRFPLRADPRTLILPQTPTHEPAFDYNRLLSVAKWGLLARMASYLPFATSEDVSVLYCADREGASPADDSPVVAVPVETAFRLIPALLRSPNPRSAIAQHAEVAYGSIRQVFTSTDAGLIIPWDSGESSLYRPEKHSPSAPFDWGPWLTPEPGEDQECAPYDEDAIDVSGLSQHLVRIAAKLKLLRRLDPAYVIPGAEQHHHLTNPRLLPAERQAFEQSEGIRLPEVYARFLMEVGNGDFGPWTGLERVEFSSGLWRAFLVQARTDVEPDLGHLARPFPHRAAWNPNIKRASKKKLQEYFSAHQVQGTIILGNKLRQDGAIATIRLVVSGPERGHIWTDDRPGHRGIRPVNRAGPYSFLAWHEGGIDTHLASVENDYRQIAAAVRC